MKLLHTSGCAMLRYLVCLVAVMMTPHAEAQSQRFVAEVQALDDAAEMCLISNAARSNHCRALLVTVNQITKNDVEVWDRFHRSNGNVHPANVARYQSTLEKVKKALDLVNSVPGASPKASHDCGAA